MLTYYDNSTKPKYSDDYGETFIELTNAPPLVDTGGDGGASLKHGACISNTGKICLLESGTYCTFYNTDVTTGTVASGANYAVVTSTGGVSPRENEGGNSIFINSSNDGKYIIYYGFPSNGQPIPTTAYMSADYGVSFNSIGTDSPLYRSDSAVDDRVWGAVFSDDNKYIAVVQENSYIYVRKNTFLQGIYTPTTFAAKLNTDLGYAVNTITAGGDPTTTDSTPYYRLYLQFANAVTLTGMPKDIFNIPFSDFSVKAGGQVNIRNVNFDAQMTITPSYSTPISFGYNTVFVTDSYFPLSTDFDGNAESNNMDNHPPFSNIINDATKYFDRPGMASAMNTDGSTMAMANGVLGVKVYDRDSNEPDGWKQVGGTIPGYLSSQWFATELYLSNNGQIIAISDLLQGTVGFAGYTVVYKRNPAVGIGWEIMGGNWDMQGDNVGATESRDYQRYASLSDDGTIVAVGTSNHLPGKVRVFNYDDVSNSWIQQGSTLTTTNGKTLRPVLSGDGTTVAIVDSINEEVAIHRRDSTTYTVWNTIGNISVTGLIDIDINKNGDIFAAVSTHIYVYKRDTNDASGWSLMGSAITPYSGGARIQIDDIGHTVTVTHHLYGGFVRGILMIYKYNTTSLVWEHAVTNNAISGTTNTVVAGGTDPILGYHPNQQYAVSGHTLTGDGTTVILSSNGYNGTGSECFIYTIPHIKVISNTSTIQAGNYCISQFVSTIKTDLVDFPLSYDASNALITFDSLAQDISMSITSTDTTIFDTSITEIPQGASTLPFITYGQPDPTLKNYSDNGITTSEFVSNGYTILQLISGSVIPDWNFDTDANRFDQSYLKGFTDVSGLSLIHISEPTRPY